VQGHHADTILGARAPWSSCKAAEALAISAANLVECICQGVDGRRKRLAAHVEGRGGVCTAVKRRHSSGQGLAGVPAGNNGRGAGQRCGSRSCVNSLCSRKRAATQYAKGGSPAVSSLLAREGSGRSMSHSRLVSLKATVMPPPAGRRSDAWAVSRASSGGEWDRALLSGCSALLVPKQSVKCV
jgi:hypothetical protein